MSDLAATVDATMDADVDVTEIMPASSAEIPATALSGFFFCPVSAAVMALAADAAMVSAAITVV